MSDQPESPMMEPPVEPPVETPVEPVISSSEVSSDDKLWSALAYIFPVVIPIILLLMEDKKKRPFIRYHAYQSLVAGIVLWVIYLLAGVIIPIAGWCIGLIFWLPMLYWAYKAYLGEYVKIPVISDFIKNQGWAK